MIDGKKRSVWLLSAPSTCWVWRLLLRCGVQFCTDVRCKGLYRRALQRNASSRWHRTEKSVATERYETAKESILDGRTGDHIMSPSKPITRGADISVLVIIAGLYLGLFLTRNVEQYQNQNF